MVETITKNLPKVGAMVMRPSPAWDQGIADEVLSGVYQVEDYPKALPRFVVDLGAHIGTFSRLAAVKFPGVKIIAIEPCRENYEIASFNLRDVPHAIAIHAAIGDANKMYRWERSCVPENTGGGGVEPDMDGDARGVRLSDIIRVHGPIDLLKTDCEGAEWLWLLDLESNRMLSEIRMIVGEVHGKDWYDRLHLHLDLTHDITMCRPVDDSVKETQGYFTAIRKEAA